MLIDLTRNKNKIRDFIKELNNNRFQSRINTANNNWLEIPIKDVLDNVLGYFDDLTMVIQ